MAEQGGQGKSGGQGIAEFRVRMLTAGMLLPGLAVVYYGGAVAIGLYVAVGLIMVGEALRTQGIGLASLRGGCVLVATLAPGLSVLVGEAGGPAILAPAVMASGVIAPEVMTIAAVIIVILSPSWVGRGLTLALMLVIFCFIDLTLRGLQHWLVLLAVAVIAADTAAFFGGRFFGGAKLAPVISPSKTWSGAISGLIGGGMAAMLTAPLLGISTLTGAIMGVFIADFAIGGDLLESWFKRHYKVKDTARLLPGHGGLLDRFDGYLLAAPFTYAVVVFGGVNG